MYRVLFWMGLVLSLPSYAQTKVSGIVSEESNKGKIVPLEGVALQWLGTSVGTLTDSLGFFELDRVSGANRLVVRYLGYQADTVFVSSPEKLALILKKANELKGVTVEYRVKSTTMSMIDPIKTQQIGQKELFKAACCNLSESFETNPSVDVSFTDAVTGSKQIQLLGLAGPYTLLTQENIPSIRGFNTINGLSYLPGTWIGSMQLSKGTGSVVNGYEGIAGQLNVELRQPYDKERFIYNAYAGQGGRVETNVVANTPVTPNLHTGVMLHYSNRLVATDRNGDLFYDNPTGSTTKVLNRWDWQSTKGINMHGGFIYTTDDKVAGAIELDQLSAYRFDRNLEQLDVFLKTGYIFPAMKYRSVGLQLNYIDYRQKMNFGGVNRLVGNQRSAYANLIYQDILFTTDHKIRAGINAFQDDFEEVFNQTDYSRKESVVGAFGEYTFQGSDKFSVVAGARVDQHNLFGLQFTPRLNIRYEVYKNHVLRASAGVGRKTANPISENSGLLASARKWMVMGFDSKLPYGLQQERATSLGLNYTWKFELDYREGYFGIDLYRTDFSQQVVVDVDQSARNVMVYNLAGPSFANALQVQLDYELFKHFDVRLAYRYYDVQTQFSTGLLQRSLVAKNRYFINLGYETRNNWIFDLTINTTGRKRLPSTSDNPQDLRLANFSPAFTLLNAQVTKKMGTRWEIYAGAENVLDFIQERAIVSAENPNSEFFDASMIWGPVFGRMAYVGLRYTITRMPED